MAEHCHCGHHHHGGEERPLNKYEQALAKYKTELSDE